MDFVPWTSFERLVTKYGGDVRVRTLRCTEQFRAMAFAQMTYRDSLRDIEACLGAQPSKLYGMGFRHTIAKSTLADANESRDWRLWYDLAAALIRRARKRYTDDSIGVDLDNTVYALDSTTIDRSVPLAIPLGRFSFDQGRRQDAYAARSARSHSKLYPCFQW
jgi:Domain of unknown function (DUF4372)